MLLGIKFVEPQVALCAALLQCGRNAAEQLASLGAVIVLVVFLAVAGCITYIVLATFGAGATAIVVDCVCCHIAIFLVWVSLMRVSYARLTGANLLPYF